ncbi:mannose-6-phosphate isomerase [Candidatus Nanopelagicus hibericus]|uniref:Mannose-6-phosphate isomerase n=1 Tax=Candidatus Nanopelagicus hibericus TaxID=1884915 RepID=A0A249K964_9ACTN|nr:class I mannose-6-phosphate isomerase [Candidatus Nanopelagicus hibericus]ASY13269.1 mannose-6-phosphate isomerase [Candidatus Nanopelagicus hibericus]
MSSFVPQPAKLPSNQFDHFYKGGYRIGKLRNGPGGPMRPEEWIASTTTRFGQQENGLSKLPNGQLLKDAVAADPKSWLGEKHIQRFGISTEILVKLLDPDQRLPVHYHPDQRFAKEKLQLNHGKTEAWIILEAPVGAKVGIGFKNQMAKNEVAALVSNHDSTGLLNSLEFKQVQAGDAVFVPAGVPHAIESGIFVLELQEPTDLSILLEWDGFAVDGDKDGHLNLGFDTALDALQLEPLTDKQQGQIISRFESTQSISHAIFKSIADDFFRADYLTGDSRRVEPGFGVFLALAGNGLMKFSNASAIRVNIGDAIVVPHSAGELSIENCAGIFSRPPKA